MPVTLNIQGTANVQTNLGTFAIGPLTVTGSIAPQVAYLTLVSGNNTIAVPASAVGVLVAPPTGNGVVLKYKTTSGDVGVNIPQNAPSLFIFDPSNLPSNIYLNAASNTSGQTQVLFF